MLSFIGLDLAHEIIKTLSKYIKSKWKTRNQRQEWRELCRYYIVDNILFKIDIIILF